MSFSGAELAGAELPGAELAGVDLAEVSSRFARLLHAAGVPVTPERAGRFAAALSLAPPATVSELYWLGRVTLVADRGSFEVYDAVFGSVFRGWSDPADFRGDHAAPPAWSSTKPARPAPAPPPRPPERRPSGESSGPSARTGWQEPDSEGDEDRRDTVAALLSATERLRHEDFARLTADELASLRAMTDRMGVAPPPRRSRRMVRHSSGSELDVRATLRRAHRTGGEPFRTVRRRRRTRPRRLVLICDISGSMEPYSRAYLQLLVSGVSGARAEAFVFATRLTRLTRAMKGLAADAALERAGREAPDWSGGTRIGAALKEFNDDHGRRGVARGAVVLLLSDGWDTGPPELLAREMGRLGRLAHRIVWVNPRKAAPGYAPLAGGMAAALPHVDAFVSGHSLAALDEVVAAIGAGGR